MSELFISIIYLSIIQLLLFNFDTYTLCLENSQEESLPLSELRSRSKVLTILFVLFDKNHRKQGGKKKSLYDKSCMNIRGFKQKIEKKNSKKGKIINKYS